MSKTNKGAGRTKITSSVPKGVNYLFAIGIDRYQHFSPLFNCRLDVEALVEVLQGKYQFDKAHTIVLLDEEATRQNILKELKRLVRTITEKDNLLFYFSGHGNYDDTIKDGCWIPVEGDPENDFHDCIPNRDIQQYVKSLRSHHTVVIADSCFSGSLFAERNANNKIRDEGFASRWALTSGRNEPVSDGEPGSHSPFAASILELLRKNNEPALPLIRLIDHVRECTAANAIQIPRGEPIHMTGHKGGQFYFHLKSGEVSDWTAAQKINTKEAYTHFLSLHPEGQFCEQARKFLEEEKLWEEALQSNTIAGYRKYIQRSHLKKYHSEAMASLERLNDLEEEIRRKELKAKEAQRRKEEEAIRIRELERKVAEAREAQRRKETEEARIQESKVPPSPIAVQQMMPERQDNAKWGWIGGLKPKLKGLGIIFLVVFAGSVIWKGWPEVESKTKTKEDQIMIVGDTLSNYDTFPASKPSEPQPILKPMKTYLEPEMILVEGNGSILSFYIGKYEVTNREYCYFLNEIGNKIDGEPAWFDESAEAKDWPSYIALLACGIVKKSGKYYPKRGKENHPVNCISWTGARMYCEWLSRKTKKNYRLPFEYEWEYAAKGGKKSKKYKYSGGDEIGNVGWYFFPYNSYAPVRVGELKPNELGLYDMTGNVWEWCGDSIGDNYAARGCCWGDTVDEHCLIESRMSWPSNTYSDCIGFRIVLQ